MGPEAIQGMNFVLAMADDKMGTSGKNDMVLGGGKNLDYRITEIHKEVSGFKKAFIHFC